jgi:hypothetical protein
MIASVKAFLYALYLFALFCYERMRAVCARVDCWARGGVVRYVPRSARLARVMFDVDDGLLCACDVMTPNGSVLKTLCRGKTHVDVEEDTLRMKAFQANVMVVEPHGPGVPDPALAAAREFLVQRCGGFAGTWATVSEVVRLAEAAACLCDGSLLDRLTIVTVDFEELQLSGSDYVALKR